MKIILYVLGFLFILMGIVWALQGFNILPGSLMSGRVEYSVLGLALIAIGIGLLVYAVRRARIRSGGKR